MNSTGQLTIYCGCRPVVDAEYESESNQSPMEAVVDALSEASGTDPMDLPPLYEFVDPAALNGMFDRYDGDSASAAVQSFQIDTWNVFVRADGRIRICDAARPIDPEPVFKTGVA